MKASEFGLGFAGMAAFLAGSFAILPSIAIETVLALFVVEAMPLLFLNAMAEEFVKFFGIFAIIYASDKFNTEETVFIAGILGFGFGFSENALFMALAPSQKALEFLSFRTIAPLPMHVITAAALGLGIAKGRNRLRWILLMFLIAVIIHFAFNTFFILMQ